MATIDDLPITDFSSMSDEELLEMVKGVRTRRRNPAEEIKQASIKKAIARKKTGKATALKSPSQLVKGISAKEAEELLKIIGG